MNSQERSVSPFVIIVALGVIAAMLYPFYGQFVATQGRHRFVADSFGVVVGIMCALALFHIVRVWLNPRPKAYRATAGP